MSKVFPFSLFFSLHVEGKLKFMHACPNRTGHWKIPLALYVDEILQEWLLSGIFSSSSRAAENIDRISEFGKHKKINYRFFSLSFFQRHAEVKKTKQKRKVVYTIHEKRVTHVKTHNKRKMIFTRGFSDKTWVFVY